jgi:hypothetical protein
VENLYLNFEMDESILTDTPSTPMKRIKKTEYRRQTKNIQNVYNFFVKYRLTPNFEKLDFTKTQNVTADAKRIGKRNTNGTYHNDNQP